MNPNRSPVDRRARRRTARIAAAHVAVAALLAGLALAEEPSPGKSKYQPGELWSGIKPAARTIDPAPSPVRRAAFRESQEAGTVPPKPAAASNTPPARESIAEPLPKAAGASPPAGARTGTSPLLPPDRMDPNAPPSRMAITPPAQFEIRPIKPFRVPRLGAPLGAEPALAAPVEPLKLEGVLTSLRNLYPLMTVVDQERRLAGGALLSAMGAFDVNLYAENLARPVGFYHQNRFNAGLEQQTTFWGAKVFAGYKLGRGSYPERQRDFETHDGGEFSGGFKIPLLQNNAIDKYRAGVRQAQIDVALAEPAILEARIDFSRTAAFSYWDWVSAGLNVRILREQLQLALERQELIQKLIKLERSTELDRVNNQQIIFDRQNKLISAEQKLQSAGVKLSLFRRAADGEPQLPSVRELPEAFPEPFTLEDATIESDLQRALNQRPEILTYVLGLSRLRIDQQYANNQFLPNVEAGLKASSDVGDKASRTNDKGQWELDAGLLLEVPIQRRLARGKITQVDAKIIQTAAKLQFQREKVIAEVQMAVLALEATWEQLSRARDNLKAARETERLERFAFENGRSDVLKINLREVATASAALQVVEVLGNFHRAYADYLASLGVDTSADPNSAEPPPGPAPPNP
jgi:outer membrane protein TolC